MFAKGKHLSKFPWVLLAHYSVKECSFEKVASRFVVIEHQEKIVMIVKTFFIWIGCSSNSTSVWKTFLTI